MKPGKVLPVKLFCGILYSDPDTWEWAEQKLVQKYGAIDYKSPRMPFTITDYYNEEMGEAITRFFVSFERLVLPNALARIKIEYNEIEDLCTIGGRRQVNIDPGYMDYDKVVLASAKYNAHKIYLDFGIYADLTLIYSKGRFKPSLWAFPDFRSGQYQEIFLHIRAKYKGQLRKWLRADGSRE
jgi:hypothetical protein